ncbi:MAG: hypothetical protein DCC75_00060 [Proteobacteria bacterium]|nr:MAG: hypothetical protein DCC75_00060 [Pseudomonadota bacterium]
MAAARDKESRGIAALEGAILTVLLVSLLSSAWVVGDLISRTISVHTALDRALYDHALKSLTISSSGQIAVNEGAIQSQMQHLLLDVSQDLISKLGEDFSEGKLRVEIGYAIAGIDADTGLLQSLDVRSAHNLPFGTLSPPPQVLTEHDLQREFERLSGPLGNAARYALPSAGFGQAGADQYLPFVVFVGLRIFVDMRGSFSGRIIQEIGAMDQPIIGEVKGVALRGEVAL